MTRPEKETLEQRCEGGEGESHVERRGSWQAEGPASAKAVSGEPGSPICGRAEASVAGGEGGK